jgi:hypothetical protein
MISKDVRREMYWDYLLCTESDALLAGLHLALLVLVVFPNIDKIRAYVINARYRGHKGERHTFEVRYRDALLLAQVDKVLRVAVGIGGFLFFFVWSADAWFLEIN